MFDRQSFCDAVRANLFGGTLTVGQLSGINAVLDEWERRQLTDLRWLAYMLATDKHETNATMQAVREAYWLSEAWRRANLRYWPWYGRGLVQLTWERNYLRMEQLLGVAFTKDPDLALDLRNAVLIMFEGMLKAESDVGDFTGKCLEQFFNGTTDDPVGARAIINGTDRAEEIADIHRGFLRALTNAGQASPPVPRVLRRGDDGPDVAALQRALGIVPDGQFGPKTDSAVRMFQADRGLVVDGLAGAMTMRALGI